MFQGMLFVMLGGMITAPAFVDERMIFYKQADANFYSAFPFILGKALSKFPQVSRWCPVMFRSVYSDFQRNEFIAFV